MLFFYCSKFHSNNLFLAFWPPAAIFIPVQLLQTKSTHCRDYSRFALPEDKRSLLSILLQTVVWDQDYQLAKRIDLYWTHTEWQALDFVLSMTQRFQAQRLVRGEELRDRSKVTQ